MQQAQNLFTCCHQQAHNRTYGGYLEHFNKHWEPQPPTTKTLIGSRAEHKTLNTHLHLLEAVISFYQFSNCVIAKEALIELTHILTGAVTRGVRIACFDIFQHDWSLPPTRRAKLISYGHAIENSWLLIAACRALDVSPYPLLPQAEKTLPMSS